MGVSNRTKQVVSDDIDAETFFVAMRPAIEEVIEAIKQGTADEDPIRNVPFKSKAGLSAGSTVCSISSMHNRCVRVRIRRYIAGALVREHCARVYGPGGMGYEVSEVIEPSTKGTYLELPNDSQFLIIVNAEGWE